MPDEKLGFSFILIGLRFACLVFSGYPLILPYKNVNVSSMLLHFINMVLAFCFVGLTVKRLSFVLHETLNLDNVRTVKTLETLGVN